MGHRKLAVAAAVVGVAGFTGAAIAGGHGRGFDTDMNGFEEVPAVSTTGGGEVNVKVNRGGTALQFELRYRNLESPVTQSHIHFGQKSVNGGIVIFFCSNLGNGPAGTPACPQPAPGQTAVVTGTRTAADMFGGATDQGIAAGEFGELVRALRAGVAYANVHTEGHPGGEIRGQFDREGRGQDDQ